MAMRKHIWLLIILPLLVLTSAVSLSVASCAAATSSNDGWTTFRHDPSHSGVTNGSDELNYAKPLWNYTTYGPVVSSPATTDGYVFVGSKDYNIYCLDASNGQRVWNFTTGGQVVSSPAVYVGHVYVGSYDGWFYCMNIATGLPSWVSKVGGPVQSSPTVADSCVYVGSGKQGIYCFNASNGDLV
jgi:outer membrane protein assembly factor BamB